MKTEDLIGALARDLPTAPEQPSRLLWRFVPAAALLAGAVFLLAFGWRPDIASAAAMQVTAVKLALGASLAAAAGVGAMRLARPEAGALQPLAALAAIGLVVAALLLRDPVWKLLPGSGWLGALRCTSFIALMALPPLAGFLAALRAGAVTRPGIAGAFAGAASGGLAILFYGLNCSEDGMLFIGVWYLAGAAAAALVGTLAARRVLVW